MIAPTLLFGFALTQVFPVGGTGKWDYVTVDSASSRVFLTRGSHTQVVSARDGSVLADIPGQSHNHGVALVPALGRGFISDGGDAAVVIFDLASYRVLGRVPAADDADGIIYDPASGRVFVGCGDSRCVVPIPAGIDPAHGAPDPRIALPGQPEFLAADGRGRLYVNLVDQNRVAVIDSRSLRVLTTWPTAPGGRPTGLSLDPAGEHLFVGCRAPRQLIVLRCRDGSVAAHFPIGMGVDATRCFGGRAFASCRDGTLTVIAADGDHFRPDQIVATRPGARTMGDDPATSTLYLPTAEGGRFELLVVTP
ncbi:MAG TPA: hypothetical protein VFE31_00400 [Opitutaceae bacterium]|jgi:hypothetical protein|nr:hypothetical protein [Opitutaceae bacterium]